MKLGIDLSPLSKIKFALHLSGKALTEKDLFNTINDLSKNIHNENEIHSIIIYAIEENLIEKNSGLIYLKNNSLFSLNTIYKLLQQKKLPFSIDELSSIYKISSSEVSIDLEKDYRFVNIENTNTWLLTEWQIINNEVYEFLELSDFEELSLKDVDDLFLKKNSTLTKVFLPKYDRRFTMSNQKVAIKNESDLTANEEEESFLHLVPYKKYINNTLESLKELEGLLIKENTKIRNDLLEIVTVPTKSSFTKEEISKSTELFENLMKKQAILRKILNDCEGLLIAAGEVNGKEQSEISRV